MKQCHQEQNKQSCPCTYDCPRSGLCCQCIRHHREAGQLPACYFPKDIEKNYDRSIDKFIEVVNKRGYDYLIE